jgi:hypothetical protein
MKVEGKSKRGNPAGHMRYEVDYDELEGGSETSSNCLHQASRHPT